MNTFEQNLIYGRPILPLGQTYGGVSSSEIVAFRSLASAYGAAGDSFWDWQETTASGWTSMAAPLNTTLTVPQPELTSPLLREGAKSDQVLWLQEHLASAYPAQPTTGIFESQTAANQSSTACRRRGKRRCHVGLLPRAMAGQLDAGPDLVGGAGAAQARSRSASGRPALLRL